MNSKIICLLDVLCFVAITGCSIITDSSDLMGTKEQDDPISGYDAATSNRGLDTGKGIFPSDVESDQKNENPDTGVDATMVDSTFVDATMADSAGVDATMADSTFVDTAMADSSVGSVDLDAGIDDGVRGTGGTSGTDRIDTDLDWVIIEGGRFMMGSAEGIGYNDERPQHEVNVRSFKMSKTEVTVAQYSLCVAEDICSEPDTNGEGANWGKPGRDNHPINYVSWDQARKFAEWLGGRLPSEAEWEYAARSGGLDNLYPWGNEDATCEHAVIDKCETGTMEACSKPLGNTAQRLCDMAGNVWEWVEDDGHDSYIGAPSNGQAWIDNPRGEKRVLRGGSWYYIPDDCRSAFRRRDDPDLRDVNYGFRVVLEL